MTTRTKMILLYFVLVFGAGIAILWSMVKVQWVDGDEWRKESEVKAVQRQVQPAKRGNIYSSDGKILATTMQVCNLYFDFRIVPKVDKDGKTVTDKATKKPVYTTAISDSVFYLYLDSACAILHDAFPDTTAETFRNRFIARRTKEKPGGCELIQRDVPYPVYRMICDLPGWSRGVLRFFDGKTVVRQKRFPPYNNLAASVVGFKNANNAKTPYSGLDGEYDSILRGQDGLVSCRRLTRGMWLPINEGMNVYESEKDSLSNEPDPLHPTIDGSDIVATIDTRLQDIAHYSLEKSLRDWGSMAGCAILMEVETGNVLVCASLVLDTSDNQYKEMPYRNVAISDIYEPGSTFKPVMLTAFYNDPTVHIDTSMIVPVGTRKFFANCVDVKDDHQEKGVNSLPLWKAVAQSSNVAFTDLGKRFYNDRRSDLLNHIKAFFPFEKLDLDVIIPESKCHVNSLAPNANFQNFCYGYSLSVTPIRMATFYNALANKGRMVKPRFCKAIITDGEVRELPIVTLHDSICSEKTALTIRDLLVGVVETGTGRLLKNNVYSVAGKTGTAEIITKGDGGKSKNRRNNISLVGFFPADNPKYTCLVMMRDIRGYGKDASRVFKAISDCVVSLDTELDCRPTMKHLAMQKKSGNTGYPLPTVTKAPQAELRLVHKRLGLDYSKVTNRATWCMFNEPDEENGILAGYTPYSKPKEMIPNCYGMTVKDALLLCRSMGIDVTFEGYGKVKSQEPKARTPIGKNPKVHLILKN